MKVRPDCALCLLKRGINQLKLANVDAATEFKGVKKLLELLETSFSSQSIPANIGTIRDRIVKQVTGVFDPYKELKEESNAIALQLEPLLRKRLQESPSTKARFREACLIAIVGNAIEFDVMGYELDMNQLDSLVIHAAEDLVLDDIEEIFNLATNSENILYLTDNCGEIVFDKLLVTELQKLGSIVTVAVKGGPILNDATLEDAEKVNLASTANKIITTGSDAVGVILGETSDEFRDVLSKTDFIIAKGMGNWENLPEQHPQIPTAHLLRTKCKPIAESLGVDQHKNVAKLLHPGDKFDKPQC